MANEFFGRVGVQVSIGEFVMRKIGLFILLILSQKITLASLHDPDRPPTPRDCCVKIVHCCVGRPGEGDVDQQVRRGSCVIVTGCVVCAVLTAAGISALAWYLNTHRKIQL